MRLSSYVASMGSNREISDSKENSISGWGYFIDVLGYEGYDIGASLADPANDFTTALRLTSAGLCMTCYVALQFEFFNARIPNGSKIPLVLYDDRSAGPEYLFEITIRSVYNSVESFVEGLLNTYYVSQCDNRHCNCQTYIRLNELFDVVMEHILYIDRFRMLKWDKTLPSQKHNINQRILTYIHKYFELFNIIEAPDYLPQKCKSASLRLMRSRNSRTIDYTGLSIDKLKLRTFLQKGTGGLWKLKEDSLYDHLRIMC